MKKNKTKMHNCYSRDTGVVLHLRELRSLVIWIELDGCMEYNE